MMQINSPDRLDQAQAVIASLFDPQVSVAVTDPRMPQPAAFGDEAAHMTRAFPSRRNEFAAGRAASRLAMAGLGIAPCAIPAAPDRSPIWPEGIRGSISHSDTLCAAAVTDADCFLGLDLELNTDLSPGLLSTVCSDTEIARIAGADHLRLAKLIFSAKEAAYKAQYPLSRELFGFDHMEVVLDLGTLSFEAIFVQPAGPISEGVRLHGRFDAVDGHLVTAVTTRQADLEGA